MARAASTADIESVQGGVVWKLKHRTGRGYRDVAAYARALGAALVKHDHGPSVVILDEDLAMTVGRLICDELAIKTDIVILDGLVGRRRVPGCRNTPQGLIDQFPSSSSPSSLTSCEKMGSDTPAIDRWMSLRNYSEEKVHDKLIESLRLVDLRAMTGFFEHDEVGPDDGPLGAPDRIQGREEDHERRR